MTAYSLAVQADVRKRMSPPNRQDVPQISKELGIHQSTLYKWRSNWRLQGEVVPESEKDPDRWSAADKFTVVLETKPILARLYYLHPHHRRLAISCRMDGFIFKAYYRLENRK